MSSFEHVIQATNSDERAALREAGFVHVTGLRHLMGNGPLLGHELRPIYLGTYGRRDEDTSIIITPGAEVWARMCPSEKDTESVRALFQRFAPRGVGPYVPDIDLIQSADILRRVADPDHEPKAEKR